MRRFLEMLEDCKRMGQYKVLNHIKDAKPFVLKIDEAEAGDHYPGEELNLDLPFKVCSFEFLQGCYRYQTETGKPSVVTCIVAEEMAPGNIVLYAKGDFGKGSEIRWSHQTDPDDRDSWEGLAMGVQNCLQRLRDGQHGTTAPRTVFKWKERGEKKQIRINQVIHIRPRESSSLSSSPSPGNVQWSHAFWVMGHWRTIKGIGKDRDGVYRISGKTWVDAFVKQSELGDPVRKIRLLGDQD